MGYRVGIQVQDSGSRFRVWNQSQDSGSGIRVRIQDQGSWSKSGSLFRVYLRVCFVVKGLKDLFSEIFVKIQLLILEGNPIANFRGGVKLISRTVFHS